MGNIPDIAININLDGITKPKLNHERKMHTCVAFYFRFWMMNTVWDSLGKISRRRNIAWLGKESISQSRRLLETLLDWEISILPIWENICPCRDYLSNFDVR